MEIFVYVALALAISNVQFSWCQISENARIRPGLKTSTEDSLELDEVSESERELFDKLEKDEEEDHIANIKLLFEDYNKEARDNLKDHYYDDDHINWKTDSTPKPLVNLDGRNLITRIADFQELTLRATVQMFRNQFLKPSKLSFRRARLEDIYKRIVSLIVKDENYSNNILVLYSTIIPTVIENLKISDENIEVIKTMDKILKTPVMPYYFQRFTGISSLRQFSLSYLYQEFNNTLELVGLEDNEFNRKLATKFKGFIKNLIEILREDIHENLIPLDSIYFIFDKIDDPIIPFIENTNQNQAEVEKNARDSKPWSFRKRESKDLLERLRSRTRKDEDLEEKEIKNAEKSLKIMIEYLLKMGIIEAFTKLY